MKRLALLPLVACLPAFAQAPKAPTNLMVDGAVMAGVVSNSGVRQGAAPTAVCTTRIVGSRNTYDVGPGQAYAEPDKVPFGSLGPGDVVNIHARPTAYKWKFGLRAQGTASQPVIIHGVTDAACNKPVFDFNGSRTASGSSAAFGATAAYNESLGGIVIKRGPNDAYGSYMPKFIVIQGLQLQGTPEGATYTTIAGATEDLGSAACIWVQQGEDIVLRNNTITNCGYGIFTMAKDGLLSETTTRLTISNNRIWGHGKVGSYLEHGLYIQAASPVVEGNYIGVNRPDSIGSSYKSRSSGEIFRRNHVVCTARCIDMVHSEDQARGIQLQSDYGTDYVYGNTILSDGPEAIHYGGDNLGEQGNQAGIFVPTVPYRRHLYFWNNNYTLQSGQYRGWIFALSEKATEVDAWGNTFNLNFTGGELSWLTYAGQLRLGPGNVTNGSQPQAARVGALNDGRYSVTTVTAVPTDPRLATLQ